MALNYAQPIPVSMSQHSSIPVRTNYNNSPFPNVQLPVRKKESKSLMNEEREGERDAESDKAKEREREKEKEKELQKEKEKEKEREREKEKEKEQKDHLEVQTHFLQARSSPKKEDSTKEPSEEKENEHHYPDQVFVSNEESIQRTNPYFYVNDHQAFLHPQQQQSHFIHHRFNNAFPNSPILVSSHPNNYYAEESDKGNRDPSILPALRTSLDMYRIFFSLTYDLARGDWLDILLSGAFFFSSIGLIVYHLIFVMSDTSILSRVLLGVNYISLFFFTTWFITLSKQWAHNRAFFVSLTEEQKKHSFHPLNPNVNINKQHVELRAIQEHLALDQSSCFIFVSFLTLLLSFGFFIVCLWFWISLAYMWESIYFECLLFFSTFFLVSLVHNRSKTRTWNMMLRKFVSFPLS